MQWLRVHLGLSTLQRRIFAAFVSGTLAIVLSLALNSVFPNQWARAEGFFTDLRNTLWTRYLGPSPNDPPSPVTVIDIDDRTMEQLGVYGASYRKYHAQLIDTLAKYHAGVVVFDILFKNRLDAGSELQSIEMALAKQGSAPLSASQRNALQSGLDVSTQFETSIKKFPRTVVAAQLGNRLDYPNGSDWEPKAQRDWQQKIGGYFPIQRTTDTEIPQRGTLDQIYPELAQSSQHIGIANMVPDADGKLRSLQYLWQFPDTMIPATPQFPMGGAQPAVYATLSLQAARILLGKSQEESLSRTPSNLQLGPPIRIWKNAQGALKTSCPGLTEWMLFDLIRNGKDLLETANKENVYSPTSYITIHKQANSSPLVIVNATDTIPKLVSEFIAKDPLNTNKAINTSDNNTIQHKVMGDDILYIYPSYDTKSSFDSITLAKSFVAQLNKEIRSITSDSNTSLPSLTLSNWIEIWWDKSQNRWMSSLLPLNGEALTEILELSENQLNTLRIGDTLDIGKPIQIPTQADYSNRLFFPTVAHSNANNNTQNWIRHVSYADVLQGRLDPALIAGRAFVIGSSATALADFVDIPIEARHPGVDIQALALHNLLTGNHIRTLPSMLSLSFPWIAGFVLGLFAIFFSPLKTLAGGWALLLGWFGIGLWAFEHRLWLEFLPVAAPLALGTLLILAIRYAMEEKDRRFLHKSFGTYVAPELIEMMVEKRVYPKLGGQETQITALFTDIQSFSSFSEALGSPTKLVLLLNEYLSEMTDILLRHQGTLDKYIGDAIVGMFGAPLPVPNHAQLAIESAVAMQNTLVELQKRWQSQGDVWPDLVKHMRMRIGLNTGTVVTGNMGSTLRMNYTMMGDDVNLAARLESAAKQYGVWILASEATIQACDDSFLIRKIDCVRVVGKSDSVNIFEVLGHSKTAPQSWHDCVTHFEKGMQEYLAGNFANALQAFEKSKKFEPWIALPFVKSSPSSVLIKRCQHLMDHPPVQWDGIHTATEK